MVSKVQEKEKTWGEGEKLKKQIEERKGGTKGGTKKVGFLGWCLDRQTGKPPGGIRGEGSNFFESVVSYRKGRWIR